MTSPRFALAFALALLVSACSRAPEDLQPPTLDAQFGTEQYDENAYRVALNGKRMIYTLGGESADINFARSVLTRLDRSGKTLWTRKLERVCFGASDICGSVEYDLSVDATGNAYVLRGSYTDGNGNNATLEKFNPSGTLTWSRPLFRFASIESHLWDSAMDASSSGESYVATQSYYNYDEVGEDGPVGPKLRKFSADGTQLWVVPLGADNPSSLDIAPGGEVYIATRDALLKYSSSGALIWQRSLATLFTEPPPNRRYPNLTVAVSRTGSVYLVGNTPESGSRVLKYSSSGSRLWTRSSALITTNIAVDGRGDAYVTGSTASARQPAVQKYSSSGSRIWTRTYEREGANGAAYGVTVYSRDEFYVSGHTGEPRPQYETDFDAFVSRINVSGSEVWTR